ncbi:CCA tRNA nucleotidyltransferase 1, mitochondrial-like [Clytia hemisphaerica]|uniref:CCA tRNA nucleotidyltransferase 1, mitochondrial n=1 Tax=Clytia hemisphaerica TaxID=252671 RepID=A0A7M5UUR5_9CNID
MLKNIIRRYVTVNNIVKMQRRLDVQQPEVRDLLQQNVLDICKVFERNNYEIRLIGGCVRDMLVKKQCKDIDLSTTATPDQMIAIFKKNSIRYIETGLQHGTLTVHFNGSDYEITTLRIDVETYGRAAKVEFTNDWRLDAERRDLTVNAMSLDVEGNLYDYFDGEKDLQLGKVRFVGNPNSRIREDYLRILRYFRFYGKISPSAENHENETLTVIEELAPGLRHISVERVWMEVSKIMVGNLAPHLLQLMYRLNVASNIGLPDCQESYFQEFEKVWSRSRGSAIQPVCLISTLVDNENQASELCLKWKVSNFERSLCCFIVSNRNVKGTDEQPLKAYQDIIVRKNGNQIVEMVKQLLLYQGKIEESRVIETWNIPKFPVNGADLKKMGVKPGPDFGKLMNSLKELWIESDFTLTKELLKEEFKRLQK